MLQHASYRYPSELVPLLEAALAVLALWWLTQGRRRPRIALPKLRGSRAGLALFLAGILGGATLAAIQGFPVPRVSDEISYLIAADTFAHGRFANPVHPFAEHFTPEHVLVTDSVMASKYPPAQGLVLAVGQWLGHPGVGLWLLAGLLPMTIWWALRAWMPDRWALVGGVLVLLRLGWGSYWNQSYWGGNVAAVGGALVLGALGRWVGRRSRCSAWAPVAAAAGITVLANSRPFEGMLLVAGLGVVGLVLRSPLSRNRERGLGGEGISPESRASQPRPPSPQPSPPSRGARGQWRWMGVLAAVVLLALVAVGMASYNQQITGEPWTFPHARYADDGGPRNFVWQLADPGDDRSGPPSSVPWVSWLAFTILDGARDVAGLLFFSLGISLFFAALVGVPWLAERPAGRWATIPIVFVLAGHAVTTPWLPHYSAPLLALFLWVAVEALRILSVASHRGHRFGARRVIAGAVAIQAVLFAIQIPAHRPDAGDWSVHRARIDRELQAIPGQHLVLVSYPRGRDLSWSWNGADPDRPRVVWADALGEVVDRQLIESFEGRTLWCLDVDLGLDLAAEPPQPARCDERR